MDAIKDEKQLIEGLTEAFEASEFECGYPPTKREIAAFQRGMKAILALSQANHEASSNGLACKEDKIKK